MGSDSDGVDYESLAAAVLAVVIVALTTLTRNLPRRGLLASSRTRAVGVWEKILIEVDGREHRQREEKTTFLV